MFKNLKKRVFTRVQWDWIQKNNSINAKDYISNQNLKSKSIKKSFLRIFFEWFIKRFWFYKSIQHQWGRKLIGGTFYYIQNNLSMPNFWSDKKDLSCMGVILKTEYHGE